MDLVLQLIHLLFTEARNGLHGKLAVKKLLLRKGNGEKRLRYAKWHKNWTDSRWQQVLWSDESSPEPRPHHYWSDVGSTWQRTEQKAADIQIRPLKCPLRSLENYSWRLLIENISNLVEEGSECVKPKMWSYQILTFDFVSTAQTFCLKYCTYTVYIYMLTHVQCTSFLFSLKDFCTVLCVITELIRFNNHAASRVVV